MSDIKSPSSSTSDSELAPDEGALDATEMIDSPLIFVWSGKSTLAGSSSTTSSALSVFCRAEAITPVDLEMGDFSTGVIARRDEGESKDCDRMRTLGDGVRGGGYMVAMLFGRRSDHEV